ncbi:glycosyltransferase [Pedobacter hartonius]|uniref:Glycosyltransferase involved in cell wall bisynthesis n=1 Tax=Pedobacter hartonius TaxID=425514 RepID=A0A1H3ZR38_9SPHI|nr:glycosyltransferase [Pedobacter hartonius]SEA25742.1 Glycosyltransferase involved in cell wall bisynthesis [Pedobacter hartonius]
MKKRILFITQDLARTGSEMVLWYLLKNLNKDRYEISVFCIKRGEMYDQLPDYVKKETSYKYGKHLFRKVFRGLLKFFGIDPLAYQLKNIQSNFKADIWYVNTLAIPAVFNIGRTEGVKIVSHIHELLYAFSLIKGNELEQIISYSDICVACSDVVAGKLAELGHRDIRIQYSFIDTSTIDINPLRIQEIRDQLGISADDFVWAISGRATYMKGLDYVLPILEHFKDEAVKIVWIGPQYNTGLDYYVRSVADSKYPGKLIKTGAQSDDYYNYLSVANGLLLLSREESFSLTILEAAYLGIPVVSFNVGVAGLFIKEGIGTMVNSWNVEDIFGAMKNIHRSSPADQLKMKEAAMEYSSFIQVPKYEKLLNEICATLDDHSSL